MLEDLTFRCQDGKEAPGRGELTLYGPAGRTVWTTFYALTGLLLGLATFVPGPHMCVTWVFPFVGAFLAWRTWGLDAKLVNIQGICPACDAVGIELPGGTLTVGHPLPQVCSKCLAVFDVVCEPAETKYEG